MKHTLVATLDDHPSVLNRVVSLFRQRGFAIESLTIGRTHEPHVSRLTLVVDGSKTAIEQVTKQLYKVIEVRSRNSSMRAEIMQVVDIYRARIVDVQQNSLTVEVTGPSEKVDSLVQLLRPYGIKEMVRTGVVAMSRGTATGARDGAVVGPRQGALASKEPPNLVAISSG